MRSDRTIVCVAIGLAVVCALLLFAFNRMAH
jgi:hypothetical protein